MKNVSQWESKGESHRFVLVVSLRGFPFVFYDEANRDKDIWLQFDKAVVKQFAVVLKGVLVDAK